MKFISQIKDAAKYTFRDWKSIVLLGIILCIASTSEELYSDNPVLLVLIIVIGAIIVLIEEGYRYMIIKETIEGHNRPPIIRNFPNLIKEGFSETITLLVYVYVALAMNKIAESLGESWVSTTIQILIFISILIIYLLLFGYPIYKALNGSKFLSGFDIIGILKLYSKIGIVQSFFLILIGAISMNVIYSCVFNIGIFETFHFIEFILSFFINPIILLFITRLMALCGREAIPS